MSLKDSKIQELQVEVEIDAPVNKVWTALIEEIGDYKFWGRCFQTGAVQRSNSEPGSWKPRVLAPGFATANMRWVRCRKPVVRRKRSVGNSCQIP